jgi:hypothetical protein
MRRSVPSARILPLVASFLFIVRLGAGKGGRLQPNASEKGGEMMSFIDVAIPAVIGLVALVWPHAMFYGSRTTPDEKKIRLIRGAGMVLLLAAAVYLVIKLAA